MNKYETRIFIDTYMHCYHEYLELLYTRPPILPTLLITLNENRLPENVKFITNKKGSIFSSSYI